MSDRFAEVVFNRPLQQRFTYRIPQALSGDLRPGVLVEAPFASRAEIGCVVAITETPPMSTGTFRVLEIRRVASEGCAVNDELRSLARWIADYYFCSEGEALAAISPIGFSDIPLKKEIRYKKGQPAKTLTTRQQLVHTAIPNDEVFTSLSALSERCGTTPALLKKLLAVGALTEESTLPAQMTFTDIEAPLTLTQEQRLALDPILQAIDEPAFRVFLLHGVTGSGKTELYLQGLARAFQHGGTGLCLVPEIALTPQTVGRFEKRFGEEVGLFHSQMTRSEKRLLTERIQRGQIRLVIGARSAVFAPLPNLRFIIIDEEHEGSYKQGESPRYHARDVAILRAQRLGIPVVLGSATPSLESYENARRGKFTLLTLKNRAHGLQIPSVNVIHLGQQSSAEVASVGSVLSQQLREAIRVRLERGEQSLLFLNRRGFSNFLMCMSCRWVARCSDDDVALTIHRKGQRRGTTEEELDLFSQPLRAEEAWLKCHFCGHSEPYPTKCPECGSESLVAIGSGTQRIEEVLAKEFPGARVLRLDQDTISTRQAFLAAWQQMVDGEAQIILGTQMIAKGLHLERVTLVGVILADVGLFIPDFRAEEKTFSLLMQVSGRAGRRHPGEVLFQSYMPQHPAIQAAAQHDYLGYFEAEMLRRRRARFPPYERLIAINISDPDRSRSANHARLFGSILRRLRNKLADPAPVVLGPLPAPIGKIANRFRQRLLVRGASAKDNASLVRLALADREWRPAGSLRLAVDVDPQDLL